MTEAMLQDLGVRLERDARGCFTLSYRDHRTLLGWAGELSDEEVWSRLVAVGAPLLEFFQATDTMDLAYEQAEAAGAAFNAARQDLAEAIGISWLLPPALSEQAR